MPKIYLDVICNNIHLKFEVDSGSPVSIIYKSIYEIHFLSKLNESNVNLVSYSDTPIKVLGYTMIITNCKGTITENCKLYVVNSNRPPLMGRVGPIN